MKRHFFSIKKSKSPPPTTYSMDNPVFEDGTGTTLSASATSSTNTNASNIIPSNVPPHPIHVRYV